MIQGTIPIRETIPIPETIAIRETIVIPETIVAPEMRCSVILNQITSQCHACLNDAPQLLLQWCSVVMSGDVEVIEAKSADQSSFMI